MREIKKKKICIICEGYEEKGYIDSLLSKNVFSDKYDFGDPINAKSINNVGPIYQDKYRADRYALVVAFCDTDKAPYTKYNLLKKTINDFHGHDVADNVVMFGNPCTMQIILSHFAQVKLKSQSKAVNAEIIKELVGIENYDANEEQRRELFSKINRRNYNDMKKNIEELSTNDIEVPSTNFLKFIQYFENDDDSWIDEINNKL